MPTSGVRLAKHIIFQVPQILVIEKLGDVQQRWEEIVHRLSVVMDLVSHPSKDVQSFLPVT